MSVIEWVNEFVISLCASSIGCVCVREKRVRDAAVGRTCLMVVAFYLEYV